jgi:chromosome segregation ATPase
MSNLNRLKDLDYNSSDAGSDVDDKIRINSYRNKLSVQKFTIHEKTVKINNIEKSKDEAEFLNEELEVKIENLTHEYAKSLEKKETSIKELTIEVESNVTLVFKISTELNDKNDEIVELKSQVRSLKAELFRLERSKAIQYESQLKNKQDFLFTIEIQKKKLHDLNKSILR